MMTDIKESHYSNDVEKYGYLQKKTSKGLWVNRYFVTEANFLFYWHESIDYEQRKPASEKYDISEIKLIEKAGTHGITMNFMDNSKFKLEVKAAQVTERNEWFTILDAKKKLYSVDELLNDIRADRISFRTKTFQTLMTLQEREQNKWILDRLDEAFETSNNDQMGQQFRSNSSGLLLAATRAMEEFIQSCEDCEQEMASREPKIIAHSRNYIRRYADILKGRITLELLYLPGIENKQFEILEEKALCTALSLSNKIESLDKYSFLLKEFINTLTKTLFSTGDLISALIKLAAHRMDAFFEMILSSTLDVRMKKMIEIQSVLSEFLSLLKDDIKDESLYQIVVQKVLTTQLLSFADHLLLFDLSEYKESSLVEHIHSCEAIYHTLSHTYIDLNTRQLCYDQTLTVQSATIMSRKAHPTASVALSSSAANRHFSMIPQNAIPHYYFVPKDVLDLIRSACESSCRLAIKKAINDLEIGRQYLTKGLLQENSEGWIGGVLCMALIHNLNQWLDTFQSVLPEKYTATIHVEVGQVMILMYMKHLMELYKNERYWMTLSPRGIQQLKSDFECIYHWVVQNSSGPTATHSTAASSSNSTPSCLPGGNGKEEAHNEKQFLLVIQTFLLCTDTTALKFFADAVLIFGIGYKHHLYDCLRLVLKIRSDISNKIRKTILGICTEFTNQLEQAISTDPKLLEGKLYGRSPLLEEIFPLAGIEHCTGMKWKQELPSDPIAIRLTVSLMVTTIINQAVVMKKERNAYAIETANMSRSNSEEGVGKDLNKLGDATLATESPPPKPQRSRDGLSSVRYVSPQSIRKFAVESNNPPISESASMRDSETKDSHVVGIAETESKDRDSILSTRRPPQPPPPPPRRPSETQPKVVPPLSVASETPPNSTIQESTSLSKGVSSSETIGSEIKEKKVDTNPFSLEEVELEAKETSSIPQAQAVPLIIITPKLGPPPKPVRRKSNAEPLTSEDSSSGKITINATDSPSSSGKENPPKIQRPVKPLKPPSRDPSPATTTKALSPQEALNVLLQSAQKNLNEKIEN